MPYMSLPQQKRHTGRGFTKLSMQVRVAVSLSPASVDVNSLSFSSNTAKQSKMTKTVIC